MHKINSENNLSISGNCNNVTIINSEINKEQLTTKPLTPTLSNQEFAIKLDENNFIIDKNKLSEEIDIIIGHILDDEIIKISIFSKKYQNEYEQCDSIEVKNIFKSYIKRNIKTLKKYEEIINNFLPFAINNELFLVDSLKMIFIGLIERISLYRTNGIVSDYTKIDIFNDKKDFYTNIFLDHKELESIKIPIQSLMFSGYDIHDLTYDITYFKAIPSILYEFFSREYKIEEIKKYLSLNIGLG